MAEAIYGACAVLSILVAVMLIRGYRRSRARFLLWSALCFVGLALNNLLLFVDKVIFPTQVDLTLWRSATALAAMLLLAYGLVWDTE